jgi:nucleoside-diphosphate-sugar epimerase
MTHPLGLSALAFERIVDGSKGWKSPSIRKLIVRLGTLIGHSKTGNYPNLNGIYSLAVFGHGLARGNGLLNSLPFLPMPFQERARLCLIPVDLAAQAMLDLAEKHYLDTPPLGQSANQTTSYRHITDPERDVSARRLFTAALRYSGLNAPPLAIGYNQYFEKLYQRMGLDTALIKLTPFNTPSSAQAFKADVPQFCLQPMLEYFPIMIGYAQKHLVYKSPIRGGQQ